MRNPEEQRVAFDCLQLAAGSGFSGVPAPDAVVERAAAYLAFVTGSEEDDAKRKLDAVFAAISPQPLQG